MFRSIVACVLPKPLVFWCAAILSCLSLAAADGAFVFTHVNVVDVVKGRILPNRTVVVSGRAIAAVTPDGKPPSGARIVPANGKFLIPGMWDMHSHMELTGESFLPLYAANGITGIRDMGSDLDFILRLRDATAAGRVVGPRIFAAGPILDDAPADWPFRKRVKTADDGRAAVRALKRRGVDLIKVHDHTPRDAFFAIAEEARNQRLPLAGHLPMRVSLREAIAAGQGDIEHLSNLTIQEQCSGGDEYRPEACRGLFEELARRHVWQTPTLVFWTEVATIGTSASRVDPRRMVSVSNSQRKFWAFNQSLIRTGMAEKFRAAAAVGGVVASDMVKAGIRILTGCDGMIADSCVQDELEAFVRGGMTAADALRTATLNPPAYFGLSRAGSVAPGNAADLVLLDADPLADISNVRAIRAVVLRGQLLDREALDKLLEQARLSAASRP
jgi:imidazolonepropionase-like amidohydrolase